MGSVWVAHHFGLQTDVAVKFLLADLSSSERALRRFTDEASVAAQIKSPHVVQVLDHGLVGEELPYIVMELLEGENLAVHVARRGPLSLAKVAAIVQQLGHVLSKAHRVGIVHRDVKPENVILLAGYGDLFAKLIDFGVAKWCTRRESLTLTGNLVGTPDFMCPEQILSAKDVGPAADLWALAAVAYFALVGRAPFARETLPATLLAISQGEFELPFECLGIGNAELDAFFRCALCRDPAGRFSSLAEMIGTFCEVAEAPYTHSHDLPLPDEDAQESWACSSGITAIGRPNAVATCVGFVGNIPRGRATQLGAVGALQQVGGPPAIRVVASPDPTRTLASSALVHVPTVSIPEVAIEMLAPRRTRVRLAVALAALGLASCVGSAWTWRQLVESPAVMAGGVLPSFVADWIQGTTAAPSAAAASRASVSDTSSSSTWALEGASDWPRSGEASRGAERHGQSPSALSRPPAWSARFERSVSLSSQAPTEPATAEGRRALEFDLEELDELELEVPAGSSPAVPPRGMPAAHLLSAPEAGEFEVPPMLAAVDAPPLVRTPAASSPPKATAATPARPSGSKDRGF